MRMTGQQKWAAACGVQMFIIGVFGTPHGTLAQVRRQARAASLPRCRPAPCRPASLKRCSDPNAVRLTVGRSTLIDIGSPISRVSLTSADVADALVTSPNQLLVHGKVPGAISMFVWNRGGSVKRYEIVVQRDLATLNEQIRTLFPGEDISAHSNGKSVVLSGNVSRKEVVGQGDRRRGRLRRQEGRRGHAAAGAAGTGGAAGACCACASRKSAAARSPSSARRSSPARPA